MLLTTPALILATYIRAQGLMSIPADDDDWPLYVSYMPDSSGVKTNSGAIYDASGKKDGRLMAGTVIQHYGVQIKIRSSVYTTGWAKLEAIATNLYTIDNAEVTVSGEDYQICNVSRIEPIISLGNEEGTKERQLFKSDFLMTVKITS